MPGENVPVEKLPDSLKDTAVPADKLPDREAELAAQAGSRGYTYMGQAKKPGDQPGFLGNAASVGKAAAPFAGAAAGSVAGQRIFDDESESPLVRFLKQAGTTAVGTGLGAVVGGQNIPQEMAGAAMGEGIAAPIGKAAGWLGRMVGPVRSYEMGKYVGKVGEKLSEFWGGLPIKTRQDLYNALALKDNPGGAEHAIAQAYNRGLSAIHSSVPANTVLKTVAPDESRRLTELFADYVKSDGVVGGQPVPSIAKKLQAFLSSVPKTRKQLMKDVFFDNYQLTLEEAMENARLLSAKGFGAAKGATGKAARTANEESRALIAEILDRAKPGDDLGEFYRMINDRMHKGYTLTRAFKPEEVFKATKGGPKLVQSKLQQASNRALADMERAGVGDVDKEIRFGRPPGAAGQEIEAHLRSGTHTAVASPGTWFGLKIQNPILGPLGPVETAVKQIWRAIGAGTGAEAVAQNGEK